MRRARAPQVHCPLLSRKVRISDAQVCFFLLSMRLVCRASMHFQSLMNRSQLRRRLHCRSEMEFKKQIFN